MSPPSDPMNEDEAPKIVLPTPGGRRAAPDPVAQAAPAAPAPEPTLSVADILAGFRFDGGDMPVMVSAAAPLLNLAHAMSTSRGRASMGDLRREVMQSVRTYEGELGRAGILPDQARAAHYVVCATLDDVIRNTEWGGDWSVEGLVSTFHHDVTGGDKVFALLAHFQKTPGANRDLLLLIYLCLSLGFEGRSRVSPRGQAELAQVRESLFRTLRTQFDITERDLSPRWRGEDAAHRPLRRSTLFWLVSGLTLLLLVGVFVLLNTLLNRSAESTLASFDDLPPYDIATLRPIEREDPPEVIETPVETIDDTPRITVPEVDPLDTLKAELEEQIEDGIVSIHERDGSLLIRVIGRGSFETASADITDDFAQVFDEIGRALREEDLAVVEPFRVTVIGHTDDRRIVSNVYPSNQQLSQARASSVKGILIDYIPTDRIYLEGYAERLPIECNDTPEGREANRRTEILVHPADTPVTDDLLAAPDNPCLIIEEDVQ